MAETKHHDIAIIGGGPGGYVSAIKAAQMGKSVALIEKGSMGGTCLNVGCIPTKTLLASASVLHQVKRAGEFGIATGPVSFDYSAMKRRKDQTIEKIRKSLEGLIQSNRISVYRGHGSFETPTLLKVRGQDNLFIEASRIIIATGSVPLDVKAFPCNHETILNSTSLLELTELPKHLAIVGGGYIGCEFATLFQELGVEVTILEALPSILSLQGEEVARFMTRVFAARGIAMKVGVKVQGILPKEGGVEIVLEGGESLRADRALVAVGRKVYTEGLGLEKIALDVTERGFIETNEKMQTAIPNIFAIGDVTGKGMLAHVASHQGIVAAQNAAGEEARMHYNAVPAVVFTSPEIGMVGMTLEEAKKQGKDPVVGSLPFQAIGKAQAALETEGFSQIIADRKTGQILGATVIGHEASNLIAEMTLAIQNELTLTEILETIHAHPTLAEGWHEAAGIALGAPIHFPPKGQK